MPALTLLPNFFFNTKKGNLSSSLVRSKTADPATMRNPDQDLLAADVILPARFDRSHFSRIVVFTYRKKRNSSIQGDRLLNRPEKTISDLDY